MSEPLLETRVFFRNRFWTPFLESATARAMMKCPGNCEQLRSRIEITNKATSGLAKGQNAREAGGALNLEPIIVGRGLLFYFFICLYRFHFRCLLFAFCFEIHLLRLHLGIFWEPVLLAIGPHQCPGNRANGRNCCRRCPRMNFPFLALYLRLPGEFYLCHNSRLPFVWLQFPSAIGAPTNRTCRGGQTARA